MAEALALGETMRQARRRLEAAGVDSAGIDAQLIVEHVTGATRLDLIARADQPVSPVQFDQIQRFLGFLIEH